MQEIVVSVPPFEVVNSFIKLVTGILHKKGGPKTLQFHYLRFNSYFVPPSSSITLIAPRAISNWYIVVTDS